MSPAGSAKEAVRKAFPGHEALVDGAHARFPAFRSLCRDYRDCLRAIEHWSGQGSGEAEARCREYADLLLELDREVCTWLAVVHTGSRPAENPDSPGRETRERER
jgi:hypothetical protein